MEGDKELTSVVWLKRDLRLMDHQPIWEAAQRGPLVLLYIFEPEVVEEEDYSDRHHQFIKQSLAELSAEVKALGGCLWVRRGSAIEVFERARKILGDFVLLSHEEIGNTVTYQRDLDVAEWCRSVGIEWQEFGQGGVFRRLGNRDGWAGKWRRQMAKPCFAIPDSLRVPVGVEHDEEIVEGDINVRATTQADLQGGGRRAGLALLQSFLTQRGENYRSEMSSPVTAFDACSRLSPYLAWGNLSLREVTKVLEQYRDALPAKGSSRWKASLKSFLSRLSWRSHFMQKLEDQPDIDRVNIARCYDSLRSKSWSDEKFKAWVEGCTGYPMVDACMRALAGTGYLNFRMRAMVMSFASYHLWLDWRETGLHLARQFLDYEPGIHWSQVQMQSGTTGINSVRVYSPTKQVLDQDPEGVFIRKWVPELAHVPNPYLAEPHKMPLMEQTFAQCRIGEDYPEPIVDHLTAYRYAQDHVRAVRATSAAKQEAAEVMQRHGSRKRGRRFNVKKVAKVKKVE